MALLKNQQATKALEKEMKEEKAAERDRRVQAIKDSRAAREEKERYENMAEKMHRKVVERKRRREKSNRSLESGK
jgi:rRNA-processing protein CGR1